MRFKYFLALLMFAAPAMGAITITSPTLSPSLNEYEDAKLTDESSIVLPAFVAIAPDSNGRTALHSVDVQAGGVSQVTGRQRAPLYKLANGKKIPLIALLGIDPATKALVPLSFPAYASKTVAITSSASLGGATSETLTFTGLVATDTVLAVTQVTPGGGNNAVIGYSNLAANALKIYWTSNPQSGAIVNVLVRHL